MIKKTSIICTVTNIKAIGGNGKDIDEVNTGMFDNRITKIKYNDLRIF